MRIFSPIEDNTNVKTLSNIDGQRLSKREVEKAPKSRQIIRPEKAAQKSVYKCNLSKP